MKGVLGRSEKKQHSDALIWIEAKTWLDHVQHKQQPHHLTTLMLNHWLIQAINVYSIVTFIRAFSFGTVFFSLLNPTRSLQNPILVYKKRFSDECHFNPMNHTYFAHQFNVYSTAG